MRRIHKSCVLDLIVDVFILVEGECPTETKPRNTNRFKRAVMIPIRERTSLKDETSNLT